jgi:hypothetical protein
LIDTVDELQNTGIKKNTIKKFDNSVRKMEDGMKKVYESDIYADIYDEVNFFTALITSFKRLSEEMAVFAQ